MAKQLNAKIAEMTLDGLITDTQPRPNVRGGTLDVSELDPGPTVVPRGTLLGKKAEVDGKLHIWKDGGEITPDCILCDDTPVTEEDKASGVAVVAYIAGCFDPNKLKCTEGKVTLEEGELDTLRMKGILFKAAVPMEAAEN